MLWKYPDREAIRMAPIILAYIGDAVFELYVRCHMATKEVKVNKLHKGTISLVSAKAMAKYYERLEPVLTETEAEVLRRGRNVRSRHSKSAGVGASHKSTGFEALVGYLFLSGQEDRLAALITILLGEEDGTKEE